MARLFITYSPQDSKPKTDLIRRLRKAFPNDYIYIDDEKSYTDDWWNDVLIEIKKCHIFIYLLSKASRNNEICQSEFREAQRLRKPVIAPCISGNEEYLTENPDDIGYAPIDDFDKLVGLINHQKEHLHDEIVNPSSNTPTLKPKLPNNSLIRYSNSKRKLLWLPLIGVIIIVIISLMLGNFFKGETKPPPPQLGYPNGDIVTQNNQWKPVEQDFSGIAMMLVPRGCFMMGSSHNDDGDEKPIHEQCFDNPFWIDKYEVTQLQFTQFSAEKAKDNGFTGSMRPIENITWFEARAFCELRGMRLPTEREWEYASRGPNNLIYPWGNDFIADNVAYNGTASGQTAIVGIRLNGASWVGAFDMSGNVWEWVSSLYYPYPYDNDDENNNFSTTNRVLRGGSWYDGQDKIYSSYRDGRNPNSQYNDGGFRCARDYEP